jgi:phage gpG-like protein
MWVKRDKYLRGQDKGSILILKHQKKSWIIILDYRHMIKRIGSFKIKEQKAEFKKFKSDAPLILGNIAVNHFKMGFRRGGHQTEASKDGWAKRRNPDRGRAILVKRGKLKRSIRIRGRRFNRITIGTSGVPYASRHNEGMKMPKREFIGASKALEKKIEKQILKMMKI